jgi:uncharacterized phage protein (TIGR02220 family)
MLILFLNNLYKKPIEYQLLWIYILGKIDDGNTSTIQLKKLKKQFNYNKSTFYRILRFGLEFFNNDSNGISIELTKQNIIIKVIRNKKTKTIKKPLKNNTDLIKKIIDYLNEKTSKRFTINNKQTIRFINGRIKDGYNENDFKKVIDIKTEKWLNTSMEDFLRPQTLFSQKMESYLNEKNNKKKTNERFQKTQSAVDKAKQVDWFSKG